MNNTTKAPNWLLILAGIVLAGGGIVYWGAPGSWSVPGTDNPLIAWPVGIGLFLLGSALAVFGVTRH
jgi:hypothetical protein